MSSKRKTFFSIITLIILIIIFHYLNWLKPIENFLRKMITPGSQRMYNLSVNINNSEENFSSVEDLKQSYQTAMSALIKNQVDYVKLQILEDENLQLRKQLGFLQKRNLSHLGAEVIGKNIDPLGNTLIINRGSSSGIKENNPVITDDGILIGKIIKAEEEVSVIRLINDNQSKIGATILNKEKSLGLIEGGYGVSVQMNYIPQNENINTGDIIVTSGLEEGMPSGLVIGTIEAVEKEAYQPFQKAVVKPSVNLEKIRLVLVLLD